VKDVWILSQAISLYFTGKIEMSYDRKSVNVFE